MSIETGELVMEQTVKWKPKGQGECYLARVRDGLVTLSCRIEREAFCADLDGCVEFIYAIQKAIKITGER